MKTAILTVIAILVVLIIITFLLCGLIFSNLICTKPISVPDFIVRLVEKIFGRKRCPRFLSGGCRPGGRKAEGAAF